jgi:hypothetical protein
MRLRTKLCMAVAVVLFALFLLGISEPGQRYLIGAPSEGHWMRDDQYMGAALAPYVYCLVPSLLCFAISGFSMTNDIRKKKSSTPTVRDRSAR